jgi:hypothetical protein
MLAYAHILISALPIGPILEKLKMGNVRIDLANVITISLVAFVGVWVINRALDKTGMGQWKA